MHGPLHGSLLDLDKRVKDSPYKGFDDNSTPSEEFYSNLLNSCSLTFKASPL
jgi:hypothetical protein